MIQHFLFHQLKASKEESFALYERSAVQCIIHIGYAANAAVGMDLISLQPSRIPAAVLALVVLHGNYSAFFRQLVGLFQDFVTKIRMFLHFLHLLVGEPAGLLIIAGSMRILPRSCRKNPAPSSCILCELDFLKSCLASIIPKMPTLTNEYMCNNREM